MSKNAYTLVYTLKGHKGVGKMLQLVLKVDLPLSSSEVFRFLVTS